MNDRRELNKVLCFGCLSSNRALYSLGKYTSLFCKIFDDHTSYMANVSLCWECMAILRKVKLFKQKVEHAQMVLSFSTSPPASLSGLITTRFDNISITSNEDVRKETAVENETTEIKDEEEYLDVEPKIENDDYNPVNEVSKDDSSLDDQYENLDNDINDSINDINDSINTKNDAHEIIDNIKSEKESTDSSKTKKRKRKSNKKMNDSKKREPYPYVDLFKGKVKMVVVSLEELKKIVEFDRNSVAFKNFKNKCDRCVAHIGGVNLADHIKQFHEITRKKKHICNVCECTFPTDKGLQVHKSMRHLTVRECVQCGYRCYCRKLMVFHLRKHRKYYVHIQCGICGLEFFNNRDLKQHRSLFHTEYICDYCGLKLTTKDKIEQHITRNHSPLFCKQCNIPFKTYKSYARHYSKYHVVQQTEDAFCVPCDKQFLNRFAYKYHLYNSSAHAAERRSRSASTKEKLKCPECPNMYSSKHSMRNHYDFVHKQEYKYRCRYCDKRLVSKSILDLHVRTIHLENKPKKDKLCTVCGRGFATNRILVNHIRTHTGERPYQCAHCPAKFTQRSAVNSHTKRIHRNINR